MTSTFAVSVAVDDGPAADRKITSRKRVSSPSAAKIGAREVWMPEANGFVECPVYTREGLKPGNCIDGPAIVEQMDTTTVILPDMQATVDGYLNLILEARA